MYSTQKEDITLDNNFIFIVDEWSCCMDPLLFFLEQLKPVNSRTFPSIRQSLFYSYYGQLTVVKSSQEKEIRALYAGRCSFNPRLYTPFTCPVCAGKDIARVALKTSKIVASNHKLQLSLLFLFCFCLFEDMKL